MPSIITNQAAENMLRELLLRDGYRLKRRKQTWESPEYIGKPVAVRVNLVLGPECR